MPASTIVAGSNQSQQTTDIASAVPSRSYLSQIPIPPQVKIRCILEEAARQEIDRRVSDRLSQISKLKQSRQQCKHVLELIAEQRRLAIALSASRSSASPESSATGEGSPMFLNDPSPRRHTVEHASSPPRSASTISYSSAPNGKVDIVTSDNSSFRQISISASGGGVNACPSASTHIANHPITDFSKVLSMMTKEELTYHQAISDAGALIQHHKRLMEDEADDVVQCYASLIRECETTIRRILFEAERICAVNTEAELQNFSGHVLMLHASLFPWRNGILLEPIIRCAAGNPLYDKGWLADGRGEGMLFLSFAATTQVAQARQILLSESKRRTVDAANRQLEEYNKSKQQEQLASAAFFSSPGHPSAFAETGSASAAVPSVANHSLSSVSPPQQRMLAPICLPPLAARRLSDADLSLLDEEGLEVKSPQIFPEEADGFEVNSQQQRGETFLTISNNTNNDFGNSNGPHNMSFNKNNLVGANDVDTPQNVNYDLISSGGMGGQQCESSTPRSEHNSPRRCASENNSGFGNTNNIASANISGNASVLFGNEDDDCYYCCYDDLENEGFGATPTSNRSSSIPESAKASLSPASAASISPVVVHNS